MKVFIIVLLISLAVYAGLVFYSSFFPNGRTSGRA